MICEARLESTPLTTSCTGAVPPEVKRREKSACSRITASTWWS